MEPKDSTIEGGTTGANPEISPKADEPNSLNPDVLAAQITQKVLAALGPEVDKKVQSTHDRRMAKIESKLSVLDEFEALAAKLGSPEAARHELRLREIEDRIGTQEPSPATPPSSGTRSDEKASEIALGILNAFGLQSTDPEVAQILTAHADDPAKLAAGLATFYQSKQGSPAATAATIAQPGNQAAPGDKTQAQLKAGYIQEMQSARGNRDKVIAVQKKYSAQGLDISQIGFGI